jgi:RNA polymerase sigma-70 factor (ECF subfamily)
VRPHESLTAEGSDDVDDRVDRFTALYDQHYPKVLAYARARGAWQAAEDLAAETFLVAWRRLPDVPAAPLPWLLGVARVLLRNHRRAGGRQEAIAERVGALTGPDDLVGPDLAERVADRAAVRRAMATLSDRDRETLTLVAWLDLTPGEAATVVRCSTATFAVRLHRARRRLERALRAQADVPTGAGADTGAPAGPAGGPAGARNAEAAVAATARRPPRG